MENALIAKALPSAIATQLISTPHPITLEGQRNVFAAILPGESLDAYLRRNVIDFDKGMWRVSIGGVEVPRSIWKHVYPKEGQKIELVGDVGKSALFMIAIIVLTVYTGGLASAALAGTGAFAGLGTLGTLGALVGIAAVQIAGTLLINKVLGPKAQSNKSASGTQPYTSYSLSNPNNSARTYQPVPILFGACMVAPDYLSKPYSWFSNDNQYLALHMSWGIGVDHYDAIYMGTTLLSSYLNDTKTWNNGFSGMVQDQIPLFGNVDTQDGGPLQDANNNPLTVNRTSSLDTVRLDWDFEYQTYSVDKKGNIVSNSVTVTCQYRAVGATDWITASVQTFRGSTTKVYRTTVWVEVAQGQYQTQCFRSAASSTGSNDMCQVTLGSLTSIQKDSSTYAGISRTALQMEATAQLNGTPSQINAVAHSTPIPVWTGAAWVTQESSNPGAQMLKYLRGYFDNSGKLIAGCGYTDDEIDIPAFQAFMVFCAANNFTYNHWVTDDRTHLAMLEALAQAGMGEYTDAMGLKSVIWIAQDQPIDAIINMSRVQKDSFNVAYTLLGTSDGIAATYVDKTTQPWSEKTMYVPSPTSGTTTITNPANVTLEGVTDDTHAAKLARLLMGQQTYQFKSIDYSTSFEWLTYRRYSMVQMQHDLTQWGYGGNVLAASITGGVTTLQLDVQVPPPTAGNAYIGLRIPGEPGYRVFTVNTFALPTDTITLVEAWPGDAALPGSDPVANPAFDTLWIYDFKQTPGLACRVIGVQPSAGFKGATISIVPESDEFWTYVNTGVFVPPTSGSLLPQRPVAAGLVLNEQLTTIGNVAYATMNASFDIDGLCGNVLVFCDVTSQGVPELVASLLQERSASWQVDSSRQYTVTVRPYTPDGFAGVPVTEIFTPVIPGRPPTNVDIFNITDLGDGLRNFAWGFSPAVTPSPNMAGVEIRYIAGNVPAPDWDTMTDMTQGYYSAAFTSNVPAGGQWTFAIRVIDTNNVLSNGMLVKIVNLSDSLEDQLAVSAAAVAAMQTDITNMQTDIDTVLASTFPHFAGSATDHAGDNTLYVGEWSETSQRQEGDNLYLNTVNLIGAATSDRRAFILDSQTVQVTPGVSLVQTINSQQSQVAANTAAISSESTTRATADSALATQLNTVSATTNNNTAAISNEAITRANADSAMATQINTVTATAGANTVSIDTVSIAQANTSGFVSAMWALTLDVNGYISGMTQQNTGTVSTFNIRADVFQITSPSGGARTEFSGGNWRVYDASGVLRVRMGVW